MSDLHMRIKGEIERQRTEATRMHRAAQDFQLELAEPRMLGKWVPGWGEWRNVEALAAASVLRHDRDLAVLGRHWDAGSGWCACDGRWLCVEIRELATSLGIPAGEGDDG